MANSDFLKKLINAHYDNDQAMFRSAILQIAASESSAGHSNLANELKALANKAASTLKFTVDDSIDGLCNVIFPDENEDQIVVSEDVRIRLERIMKEYRERNKLRGYGMQNRSKILLEGAPGTGKTLTASVLATELQMPLFQIQMDKLITKFMGETSSKLRKIFEQIKSNRGVYLFDEFDAIGADRTLDNEVGEMRRILNTFLKFMEEDNSDSLILCATNNKKMLDQALFRRFDDVLNYTLPTQEDIKKLFELKLGIYYNASCITTSVISMAQGLSHAEISKACNDCIKAIILDEKELTASLLSQFIGERVASYQVKGA